MYVDGALSHSVVLPVGAKNITNDIAIGLRVSLDAAEQIKLLLSRQPRLVAEPQDMNNGTFKSFDREARKKLDEIDLREFHLGEDLQTVSRKLLMDGIIKPRLEEIFTHVAMEFKRSGFHHAIPAGVVVCGGGAQTVGLIEVCRKVLGLPTRIGYPQHITGLVDEIQSPAYATAAGLLIYGAEERDEQPLPTSGFNLPKMPMLQGSSGVIKQVMSFIKKFLP
jgi:cell division protein FtsA